MVLIQMSTYELFEVPISQSGLILQKYKIEEFSIIYVISHGDSLLVKLGKKLVC